MEPLALIAQMATPEAPGATFDIFAYLLRVLHIVSAVVLGGGVLYQRLALLPALRSDGKDAGVFLGETRKPWSALVGIAALLLLASGLVNFIQTNRRFELGPVYHALFGIKFLLALGVFFLSSVLAGRTGLAQKFRGNAAFYATINLLLVLMVLLIASAMRILPKTDKPALAAPAVVTAVTTPTFATTGR